jgi:hypothetical protein
MRDFNDHLCPRCFKPVETARRVGVLGAANSGSHVGPHAGVEEVTHAGGAEVTSTKNEEGGIKQRQQGIIRVREGGRKKGRSLSVIHEEEEETEGCNAGQEETGESKEGEVCQLSGEEVKKGCAH